MKRKNVYTVLLLLAVTPILSACLSYEEELWVRRDGSGSVHFRIIFSSELGQVLKENEELFDIEASLTRIFKEIEGLEVNEAGTYERTGNVVVAIKLDFDSWKRFIDVQESLEADGQDLPDVLGVVTLSSDEEGRLVFSRIVGNGDHERADAIQKKMGNRFESLVADLMQELMHGVMSGYAWKYTVHFPARVVSSNAADEDVDRQNNTVTWQFSANSIMKAPYTMTAVVEPPAANKTDALIGVAVVGFIVVVVWRLRASSSSRSG